MRNAPKRPFLPLGLALLALGLAGPALHADDDEPPANAQTQKAGGSGTIPQEAAYSLRLSLDRQRQSGLKTQALAAFTLGRHIPAYGRVVDISPLLDLRARYRTAQSERVIAEAALAVARKNQDRLAKLHSESIIPTRELILAESQLAADNARHAAAGRHMQEVREEALQSFGPELFRQAVEGESPLFEGLLRRSLVLALVALPANAYLPETIRAIRIAPSGEQATSQARLLSPAPRTEESTQGETWFFVADSKGLRTGMRLDAWIPQGGQAVQGLLIPLSAVVWRDGQPWIFVKTGPDAFVRRPVGLHSEQGGNWFVSAGFEPGEEAVVVGGQMLLSEEQRHNATSVGDED